MLPRLFLLTSLRHLLWRLLLSFDLRLLAVEHLLFGSCQLRSTHIDVLRVLIFGKFGLLVIHVAASTLLLNLQLCTFHLGIILLLLDLFSFFLESDQSELSNLFLDTLLALHFILLSLCYIICLTVERGNGALVVSVATSFFARADCALGTLAFGNRLQDDVTHLI